MFRIAVDASGSRLCVLVMEAVTPMDLSALNVTCMQSYLWLLIRQETDQLHDLPRHFVIALWCVGAILWKLAAKAALVVSARSGKYTAAAGFVNRTIMHLSVYCSEAYY
jgi:hypothetical protein